MSYTPPPRCPDAIRRCNLPDWIKIVWMEIRAVQGNNDWAWAKAASYAEALGKDASQVRRGIKRLVAEGWLVRGETTHLQCHIAPEWQDHQSRKQDSQSRKQDQESPPKQDSQSPEQDHQSRKQDQESRPYESLQESKQESVLSAREATDKDTTTNQVDLSFLGSDNRQAFEPAIRAVLAKPDCKASNMDWIARHLWGRSYRQTHAATLVEFYRRVGDDLVRVVAGMVIAAEAQIPIRFMAKLDFLAAPGAVSSKAKAQQQHARRPEYRQDYEPPPMPERDETVERFGNVYTAEMWALLAPPIRHAHRKAPWYDAANAAIAGFAPAANA